MSDAKDLTKYPYPNDGYVPFAFNVKKIDEFVNSTDEHTDNRKDRNSLTWFGIEEANRRAREALNYKKVEYIAGNKIDGLLQYIISPDDGNAYVISPSVELPYTLTGDWATDSPNFWLGQDAMLRIQLASVDGGELVGDQEYGTVRNAIVEISKKLSSITQNVFRVFDYGAKGDWDGTTGTDDTAAFQAALNDAEAAGGGVIILTSGKRYRITHTLFHSSNIILSMNWSEVFFDCVEDGSLLMPRTYNQAGMKTENFVAKQGIVNSKRGAGNLFSPVSGRNFIYKNIVTQYVHHHQVDAPAAERVYISQCSVLESGGAAWQSDRADRDNAVWGVDVDGNKLEIAFDPSPSPWTFSEIFHVNDCYAINCGYAAVHIHGGYNRKVRVQDCVFDTCYAGVLSDEHVNGVNDVAVEGCHIIRSVFAAISLRSGMFGPVRLLKNVLVGRNTEDTHSQTLISLHQDVASGPRVEFQFEGNFASAPKTKKILTVVGYQIVSIIGNKFYECGDLESVNNSNTSAYTLTSWGINIAKCARYIVSNNIFDKMRVAASIYTQGGSATSPVISGFAEVSGNIAADGFVGAVISDANRLVATGNSFSSLGGEAVLSINRCFDPVISSNYLEMGGTGASVLKIKDSVNSLSSLNKIKASSASTVGIWVSNGGARTAMNTNNSTTIHIKASDGAAVSAVEPWSNASHMAKESGGTIRLATFNFTDI